MKLWKAFCTFGLIFLYFFYNKLISAKNGDLVVSSNRDKKNFGEI